MNSNVIPFPSAYAGNDSASAGRSFDDPDMAAGMFGFSSASEYEAAMNEYTAYCENLPDGVPSPSFNEFFGRANAATEAMTGIQEEMQDMVFDSMEDVQNFMDKKMQQMNTNGIEDFLGISPAVMHNIIHRRFSENRDIVTFSRGLTAGDVINTPVMKRVQAFFDVFESYADKPSEMPLTSTGRLKPEFCHRYYEKVTGKNRSESLIKNEDDYPDLQFITIMLTELGFLDLLKTRCRLTERGRGFREKEDEAALYLEFFEYYIDDFDWGFLTRRLDEEPFILMQHSAVFSLYLLREKGGGTKTSEDIFKYFLKAFFRDKVREEDENILTLLSVMYRISVLDNFCARFGLIEQEFKPEDFSLADEDEPPVSTSPLFKKLLKWKI